MVENLGDLHTGPINKHDIFQHKRTLDLYEVIVPSLLTKIDDICDWSPCVVYQKVANGEHFCRNSMAFRKNFRKVS